MRSRALSFTGAAGHRLSARLDLPADGAPVATAVFAHCFTCSKDLHAVRHIARALTGHGFAVLRFDFTGLGESEGTFAESHFAANVDDLVAAARYLSAALEPPTLLVGHSLGGAAVLRAAAEIPGVAAVATIGAPADPQHVLHLFEDDLDAIRTEGTARVTIGGRTFTVDRAFIDALSPGAVRTRLAELDAALLLLHAPLDETVGIENARLLFDAARHPKSFVSLDRADHLLSDEDDARYAGSVIAAWASRYLPRPRRARAADAEPDAHITTRTDQGGFLTEVIANGHAFVADEPVSAGGTNEGPTPYDLVVAGLGACTSMTLQMYAQHKGWPLEAATVHLVHAKRHASDCATCEDQDVKIDHITREVELLGPLDDAQRSRLLEIADRCPVHRTLTGEIRIETHLRGPDPS